MFTSHYKLISPKQEFELEVGQANEYCTLLEKTNPNTTSETTELQLNIHSDQAFLVAKIFRIPKAKQKPYIMIPGFLYGSNNVDVAGGDHPKLAYGNSAGWPVSGVFWVRADRSTHNCVLMYFDQQIIAVGINEAMEGAQPKHDDPWAPAYFYNGLLIDTSHPDYDQIGFTLGYKHYPKRYSFVWNDPKTPGLDEYTHGWLQNLKGQMLSSTTYFFQSRAAALTDYGKVLRNRYASLHQAPLPRCGRTESIHIIAQNLIEKGWNNTHKFFYLADNEDGRMVGDLAWTGGMQVAYPLMLAGYQTQKQEYINIACEFIEAVVQKAVNHNANLLYEEWREGRWQVTGWWGIRENCLNMADNPKHSAYLNGQAAYYLLKAYALHSKPSPAWLETARLVLNTALKSQNKTGAYAWLFDPQTGKGIDYNGFQSCWFVPAMALLARETKDDLYKESALKAIDHYYKWHLTGELYNTPMDTHHAVDQEGNLAFVIACVELHKLLGDRKLLDYAKLGLDYEFSWKFPYNTRFSNEPLKSMNWSASGGSVTSVNNPHIHPMGNLIAGEMFYLYQQTGDNYIAQRLRDTCIWGTGIFNRYDNDFGFGLKGMCTEQYFYSDALLLPWWKKWDGGIWEVNLPWGAACALLSCAEDIPDRYFQ